jgi:hypothetical protein
MEDEHMDSMDNFRERFEALERRTQMVEQRLRWWRGITCGVVMLSLLILALPSAQAANFSCAAGDVACLLDAINQANANGEANTITLEAGTYTLTELLDSNPPFEDGLPVITSSLIITGRGSETTIIERDASAPRFRILSVAATGTLTLKRLTLRGGSPVLTAGGGGILNLGTLTLAHTTVTNNSGGGIVTGGPTVTITHSIITDNSGNLTSGGLFIVRGTVTLTATTVAHNIGNPSGGIRIDPDATVIITASTVAHMCPLKLLPLNYRDLRPRYWPFCA